MKFKVRHENKAFIIMGLISAILFFMFVFALTVVDLPIWTFVVSSGAAVIFAILYFIEQAVGTVIVIEDNAVVIKYFLGRKRIALEEINDVDIEQYERYRRKPYHHTEYRMKMTISPGNGKKIVLTDKASAVSGVKGFFFGELERKPDDEVNLYKAYQIIMTRLK